MKHQYPNKRGFIAITAVLMLSAVFLSVSIGSVLESVAGSVEEQVAAEHSRVANVVESCAAIVLAELTYTLEYNADGSILIEDIQCEYTVTVDEYGNGEVYLESTLGDFTERVRVTVGGLSPNVIIEEWERNPV